MIGVRLISAVVFSLTLAFTAQAMAFARGQSPAEGQIVLCTGHGIVTVFVDAEGNPTSPPQLCADGMALFSALTNVSVPAEFMPTELTNVQRGTPEIVAERCDIQACARAPPLA